MNNAEKFKSVFGIYATELWAMPEKDFLEWINAEMNIKDEIYPKIKADVRLSGDGTLWIKTDKKTLEDAQRVIIEDGKTWCKQFYAEQPQRMKGHWTEDKSCQFCGKQPWYEYDIHTLKFCPYCGADMRKESNETD